MWNTFSRATSMGSNSIIGRGGIVTKVYFPREILPLSACATAFIMMTFEFGVFFLFVIFLGFIPPMTILLIPIFVVIEFILSFGFSLVLSVLNVYYRDIQYIWNVILQAGFFLTPSFYTWESVPNIKWILALNPMAQIIDMTHDVALYNKFPVLDNVIYVVIISLVILVIGYTVFHKYEKRVAEEL
jgi:lipopolysaccharide transport system permease protein